MFRWRMARRPLLLGGTIIIAGTMVPLGAFWYLLVIVAGAMAAVGLYRRNPFSGGECSPKDGAKIGAGAALFSYSVSAVLLVLACVFDGPALRQRFIEYFQTVQTQIGDPQSRAMLDTIQHNLNTPEGFATMVTAALAISFFFFLVVGAAGGALGAMLFGRSPRQR
jgi:hypothetical protein